MLRTRLDPGGRELAAQDFCHTFQIEAELVGDFIRRLECTFQLAYGRDKISSDTRTLLHSQLQEGLRYCILQTPTVSGAQTYSVLCLAAKNKEKRQSQLQKRERYRKETTVCYKAPRKFDAQFTSRFTPKKQCYFVYDCAEGKHWDKTVLHLWEHWTLGLGLPKEEEREQRSSR